jgi:hypothetical protein
MRADDGRSWAAPAYHYAGAGATIRGQIRTVEPARRRPVATDHRDQLREYRAKLADVKEYL